MDNRSNATAKQSTNSQPNIPQSPESKAASTTSQVRSVLASTRQPAHERLVAELKPLIASIPNVFTLSSVDELGQGVNNSIHYERIVRRLCDNSDPHVIPILRVFIKYRLVLNISFISTNTKGMSALDYAKQKNREAYELISKIYPNHQEREVLAPGNEEKLTVQGQNTLSPPPVMNVKLTIKEHEEKLSSLSLRRLGKEKFYILRHNYHINLGHFYDTDGNYPKGNEHISKALKIESSVFTEQYVKEYGFMVRVKKGFNDFVDSGFSLYEALNFGMKFLSFSPKDPIAIEAATDFIDKLIRCTATRPNSVALDKAYCIVGQIEHLKNRLPGLRNLVIKLPESEQHIYQKGFYLNANKQYEEVIRLSRAVLEENPSSTDALFTLGATLLCSNHYREAASTLLKSLKSNKQLPVSIDVACAQLGIAASRFTVMMQFEDALFYAEEAVKFSPNNITARIAQAEAHAQLKDFSQAIHSLDQAKVETASDQAWLDTTRESITLYSLIQENNDVKAKEMAESMLKKDNKHFHANAVISTLYERDKDYVQALNVLKSLYPNSDNLFFLLKSMHYYFLLGDYEKMETKANKVITHEYAISKYRFRAYSALYVAHDLAKTYEKGINKFLSILNSDFLSDEDKQAICYYIAHLYMYQPTSLPRQAKEFAKLAVGLYSRKEFSDGYGLLGLACLMTHDFDEAIPHLKKAIELDPSDLELIICLGRAYYLKDKFMSDESYKYFSMALAVDPSCLTQISNILPSNILNQLQESTTNLTADTKDTTQYQLNVSKELDQTPLRAIPSITSDSISVDESKSTETMLPGSPASELPNLNEIYIDEKMRHKMHQIAKKKFREALKDRQSPEEEKSEIGWDVLGFGFVSISSPLIGRVYYKHQPRVSSRLFGFLHTKELHDQGCDEDLLSKWQNLVDEGKAVGKKNQQGIRILTKEELTRVPSEIGPGYVAKLKLLGSMGNPRAYGRLLESMKDIKLYIFDKVAWRHNK